MPSRSRRWSSPGCWPTSMDSKRASSPTKPPRRFQACRAGGRQQPPCQRRPHLPRMATVDHRHVAGRQQPGQRRHGAGQAVLRAIAQPYRARAAWVALPGLQMAPEFALVVACIHSGRNGARFPCAQAVASDLGAERALAQVGRQQDQAIGFARVGAVVHQAAHAAHRRPQQPHFAISALAGRRHHFRMQALRGTSFHVIGKAQARQQHIRVRPCGLHRRDDAAGAQGRDVVAAVPAGISACGIGARAFPPPGRQAPSSAVVASRTSDSRILRAMLMGRRPAAAALLPAAVPAVPA